MPDSSSTCRSGSRSRRSVTMSTGPITTRSCVAARNGSTPMAATHLALWWIPPATSRRWAKRANGSHTCAREVRDRPRSRSGDRPPCRINPAIHRSRTGCSRITVSYDRRAFRSVDNAAGEVDAETRFFYRQIGSRVWATYRGGSDCLRNPRCVRRSGRPSRHAIPARQPRRRLARRAVRHRAGAVAGRTVAAARVMALDRRADGRGQVDRRADLSVAAAPHRAARASWLPVPTAARRAGDRCRAIASVPDVESANSPTSAASGAGAPAIARSRSSHDTPTSSVPRVKTSSPWRSDPRAPRVVQQRSPRTAAVDDGRMARAARGGDREDDGVDCSGK